MRYDREHKSQTRERVLKAAAAAIRAEGPDRVSVAALMNRVGLTHGGFYAHFASKDDLLAEAVDYMFADISGVFFANAEASDPRKALSRYIDFYLSMRHRDARDHGCPVPILAGEMHRMPVRARERFAAAVERMRTRMRAALESVGAENARERAESAVAEMVGAVLIARITHERAVAEMILASAKRSVRQKLALADS